MTEAAAKTGPGTIFLVAVEQTFPEDQRIVDDELAYQIMPLLYRVFVWIMRIGFIRNWMVNYSEKNDPGLWAGLLVRKRYINDKLNQTSGQIDGVVNLGAGFDSRVYSLKSISKLPIWELDQMKVIDSKKKRLTKIFGSIPENVQLVGIDFDHEDVGEVLKKHGYKEDRRIFFIWEGVTQYLEEESVKEMFDFLSHAESGSKICFTYVLKEYIEGKNMYGLEEIYKGMVKTGTWIFGMEPQEWPQFLESYGWRIIEEVGAEEASEMYVKPTGRVFTTTPIERFIYAEKV